MVRAGLALVGVAFAMGCVTLAEHSHEAGAETMGTAAIARKIPEHLARVVASAAPRMPGAPTVVVIRTAHLNEGGGPESGLPSYHPVERDNVVSVVAQVFLVVGTLVDAGFRTVVAEGVPGRLGDRQLATIAQLGVFPDLAGLLATVPAERRTRVIELLERGSNLDLSYATAAVFGGAVLVEGVEDDETILLSLKLGAELTGLELGLRRPDWANLQQAVLSGRASLAERERYGELRGQGLAILERFGREVVEVRDQVLADGAVALARREQVGVVLLPAGGFHTDGIVAQLEARGAGYVVVEPHAYAATAPSLEGWRESLVRRLGPPPP